MMKTYQHVWQRKTSVLLLTASLGVLAGCGPSAEEIALKKVQEQVKQLQQDLTTAKLSITKAEEATVNTLKERDDARTQLESAMQRIDALTAEKTGYETQLGVIGSQLAELSKKRAVVVEAKNVVQRNQKAVSGRMSQLLNEKTELDKSLQKSQEDQRDLVNTIAKRQAVQARSQQAQTDRAVSLLGQIKSLRGEIAQQQNAMAEQQAAMDAQDAEMQRRQTVGRKNQQAFSGRVTQLLREKLALRDSIAGLSDEKQALQAQVGKLQGRLEQKGKAAWEDILKAGQRQSQQITEQTNANMAEVSTQLQTLQDDLASMVQQLDE